MSQLVVVTFDVPELSAAALCILSAAVRHAYENQPVKLHTMRIDDFCRLAGLPATTTERFFVLLKEASKALVSVETIDTTFPERDDLPFSSWPVFNEVRLDGSKVIFDVCIYTFEEAVLARLPVRKRAASCRADDAR